MFTFNGKSFDEASAIAAGSYLVQVPEAWNNRTLTFEFDKTLDKATTGSAPSFYGNATTKSISVEAPYYTYDESANEFVAHNTGSALTLYPFMAAIKASSATSKDFDGPSPVVYHKVSSVTPLRSYLIVATDDDGNAYYMNADNIKNNKIEGKSTAVSNDEITLLTDTKALFVPSLNTKNEIKIETVPGGVYLSTNSDGLTLGKSCTFTLSSNDDQTFKLTNFASKKDTYYIHFDKNTKKFTSTNKSTLNTSETDCFSLFEREPLAYINITAPEGYATFYNKDKFYLPEGIEVTAISGAEKGKLTMEWVTKGKNINTIIDAGSALLVKSSNLGQYPCHKAWFTPPSPTKFENNCLFGTEKDKMIEADDDSYFYQLTYGTIDGKRTFGFFWAEADGAPFINKGGKAYLKLPKNVANNAQGFALLPTIAGIGAVSADNHAPSAIFTLDGRKLQAKSVEELPAGAYIVNGNKVIVK